MVLWKLNRFGSKYIILSMLPLLLEPSQASFLNHEAWVTTVNLLGKIHRHFFSGLKILVSTRNLDCSVDLIFVDELDDTPDAFDLTQIMQENIVTNLAPSDVDSRPVEFEPITNINTIIFWHEPYVSSDVNAKFNSPNLAFANSLVFQLQSSDIIDSWNLAL